MAGFLLCAILALAGRPGEAAAPKLYNMDRFLNEPHPFAQPVVPPPSEPAPRVAPPGGAKPPAASAEDEDTNDPIEPLNRFVFGFNEIIFRFILGPFAKTYNWALPEFFRDGVSNFLDNINSPVVLVNDLLQGELERAWETSARLVINSTAGIGGLIDVGDRLGFKPHKEDFGQTLAVWGVGEWFYVVLPIYGPSSPRDAVGKLVVDNYFDPLGLWLDNNGSDALKWSWTGVSGVVTYADLVEDLDRVRETSVDFYGALRSLYRQQRQAEISNGKAVSTVPNFDLDMD